MVQSEEGRGVIQDEFGDDLWIQRVEKKGENVAGEGWADLCPQSVTSRASSKEKSWLAFLTWWDVMTH